MTSKEALEFFIKNIDCDVYEFDLDEVIKHKRCLEQDLDRLEKLEKFKKLCLTKYVPLDCLSPSFWESEKEWLELMSYDYYLYLCEDVCEYVVKDNQKLTPKEFKLIYDLLKEYLDD